jgi:hypothetical protein
MAGVLGDAMKRLRRVTGLLIAGVGLTALLASSTVEAGTYQGKFTGYAFGRQYVAGGELGQGDFANHYVGHCPNDPAAHWAFGSRIDTPAITLHDQIGRPYTRAYFYLKDSGDPQCTMGNYWVDIYFGRWETRPVHDPSWCICPGSPPPSEGGVCWHNTLAVQSCYDAGNFGTRTYWYTGP